MAKVEERKKVLEREYIINVREEISKVPRYRKTEKAVTAVREFLIRHMKVYDKDKNKIKLSKWLNEYLWKRGIRNPPTKIKIRAVKFSDGIIEAELAELTKKAQIEKEKEQKIKEEAEKIAAKREEESKKAGEAKKAEEEQATKEEEKTEEKEKAEKLKGEERLLEKELEKQHQKEIIKPKTEVHKKTVMGV